MIFAVKKRLLVKEIEHIKSSKKPMAAAAEIANHIAYSALINDHLDNDILPCS